MTEVEPGESAPQPHDDPELAPRTEGVHRKHAGQGDGGEKTDHHPDARRPVGAENPLQLVDESWHVGDRFLFMPGASSGSMDEGIGLYQKKPMGPDPLFV